jgi:DNA-binding response OmpR family regulator
MRVLVVEAVKTLRNSIAQALREYTYVVNEAGDGRLALWHHQSGHIDVVILELMMPGVEIESSAREYAILEYPAMRQGEIVLRGEIWEHVHCDDAPPESSVVEVFVSFLRQTINADSSERLIHTRRGPGYMLGAGD